MRIEELSILACLHNPIPPGLRRNQFINTRRPSGCKDHRLMSCSFQRLVEAEPPDDEVLHAGCSNPLPLSRVPTPDHASPAHGHDSAPIGKQKPGSDRIGDPPPAGEAPLPVSTSPQPGCPVRPPSAPHARR